MALCHGSMPMCSMRMSAHWERLALRTFVFNESSLFRPLQAFVGYYHRTRTHLAALDKDAPAARSVQLPDAAASSPSPVGGLHQRCEPRAA